jgi:ABC-type Mn2+/Zn2+ transport system permease subunit
MDTLLQILNPSYLLFPALVGSSILGFVCPAVGAYLILRRTIFLGLTLPQVAAAGVAFAFWMAQLGLLSTAALSERMLGMGGSLLFTFLALLLFAYLERRGKGTAEGRLAAAYALAGALTILFIVFNPAGEIEILGLLKGEVLSLAKNEIKLLVAVFGFVLIGVYIFRREFLLSAFDRDLAFLLKGGNTVWDILLYLFAGLSIAVGVIMAGPLLIFGFLVLPPLAAKPLVRGMTAYLWFSSVLGLLMAFAGFYVSVRLDTPLGPTDVAIGCAMLFIAHALRAMPLKAAATALVIAVAGSLFTGCAATQATQVFPTAANATLWLARPSNDTNVNLVLPENNPLRSLAEMAGKISPESRRTVMDVLREELHGALKQRGHNVSLPEDADKRLANLPFAADSASGNARQAKLSGLLFLSDITRWNAESKQFIAVVADFKLIRIGDGVTLWQRHYQRAVPTPSATNLAQASVDAAKIVVRELFAAPAR